MMLMTVIPTRVETVAHAMMGAFPILACVLKVSPETNVNVRTFNVQSNDYSKCGGKFY